MENLLVKKYIDILLHQIINKSPTFVGFFVCSSVSNITPLFLLNNVILFDYEEFIEKCVSTIRSSLWSFVQEIFSEGWQSLAECTGLENQQGFMPFGGSNPSPSAAFIFNCRIFYIPCLSSIRKWAQPYWGCSQ